MKTKARVTIFYKDSVFDPQGNTLAGSLKRLGFSTVADVRVGKVIDIEVDAKSKEEVKAQVQKMCEAVLANPVIESYDIQLRGE